MCARLLALAGTLLACSPGGSAPPPKLAAAKVAQVSAAPPPSAASAEPASLPPPAARTEPASPPQVASAPPTVEALLALPGSASTSTGGPSRGRLAGGIALPAAGPGFVHNAKRPSEARYGSVELVQAIVRAAAVVDRELPGSVLVVNDLGLAEGGPIAQHGSHQSGRDADILFHVFDAAGKALPSVGVPLDPTGKGWDFKDLTVAGDDQRVKLDVARTWRFLQALLEVAPGGVQRIFLVEHLRTLLLAQAEKVRAPKAVSVRFAEVSCQPESPHDDHMHVRMYCTPEDIAAGCEDSPPVYPWRKQALAALGISGVIASAYTTQAERAQAAARTTSPAQARKRAGPMHARVVRFLDQRQRWIERPHPGRPYCR